MTIRLIRRWVRQAILGGGAAAGLLLAWTGSGAVAAQTPPTARQAPAPRNFLNKRVIRLPIEMDQQTRNLIREIHLYVKDHPSAPWTLRDKAGATQESFLFEAPQDGEYWFAMATVDRQGRNVPADIRTEPPGLAVVIDTQAPNIGLSSLGETPLGHLIQCDMKDQFLDQAKSRLFFQGGDKVFRDMPRVPGRANVFCIPADAVCTGVIRASAEDLAGNHGYVEAHLNGMKPLTLAPSRPQAPQVLEMPPQVDIMPPPAQENPALQAFPRPLPQRVAPEAKATSSKPQPAPKALALPQAPPVAKAEYRPDGTEGPRWLAGTPTAAQAPVEPKHTVAKKAAATAPIKSQLVNATKVFLDYQIENAGAANTAKVEAWITPDKGQSWQQPKQEASKGSLAVELPGDGLFGISLVASNSRGVMGPPPAKGDAADNWVEVDATKPTAEITDVQCVAKDGKLIVQIDWNAEDKNLAETPVELYYAATPQGPWLPIAKGLQGKGRHAWSPPASIGRQAHLRLIAKDSAGNQAIATTMEAVVFEEPAPPRAVVRTIRTSATEAPPQPAQPTSNRVRVRSAPSAPPLQIIQSPPVK